MNVLLFPVEDQQAAVVILLVDQRHSLLPHQLHQQVVSHLPQIAGHDSVIVRRAGLCIPEKGKKGVGCGGRHGRPHVVGVRNAQIDDAAHADAPQPGQRRHFRLGAQQRGSCAGYGPLGRGRTLGAKFQRIAILALGGAEMAGGRAQGAVR